MQKTAARSSTFALIEKDENCSATGSQTCDHDARRSGQQSPEQLVAEKQDDLICSATGALLQGKRFKPEGADFYERLLQEDPEASIECIPETSRTAVHYLLACQNHGGDLELVPEPHRTPEVCLAACRDYGDALQWVPERHLTPEVCRAACRSYGGALQWVPEWHRTKKLCQLACDACYIACQYAIEGSLTVEWFVDALNCRRFHSSLFLTHAKRLLPGADFQSLLERTFLCGYSTQMAMLTSKQVSSVQKEQVIGWMLNPGSWPTPEPAKASDLCDMASPLTNSRENPELQHLQVAALKTGHWTPPRYNAGKCLLGEIEQTLSKAAVVLPARGETLFQAKGNTVGGRTLKIGQGEMATYYKFQREGESLRTLMQEGAVHTVRERHPLLFGPLRSKLPGDTCFFKLDLDLLPQGLPRFDDPPAIKQDESGHSYVHVYRYVASAEYSVYAHIADHSDVGNPYRKGEQGLVTACHDIGQFVAMGLVPSSTLPAFHNSERKRQWTALHALFSQEYQQLYPGTFGGWNSVATEKCDFGYGGFRDVGDFEPFCDIESFLNRADTEENLQAPELEQSFCLVNAVCENLLAANLIRARLRQIGSDYHYKNPQACQQTEAFIEQTLLSFLKGMYAERMQSDNDSAFLRKRLELDKPAYERWLRRAAAEMLYWTAKQPDPEKPEQPPFGEVSPLYSHKDGYALHLNRTGRLDPDLYPDGEEGNAPVYPDHFHNQSGQLNLGSHNAVFPLTTLMRGLVRLCTGMLTYDHRTMPLSPEPLPE